MSMWKLSSTAFWENEIRKKYSFIGSFHFRELGARK